MRDARPILNASIARSLFLVFCSCQPLPPTMEAVPGTLDPATAPAATETASKPAAPPREPASTLPPELAKLDAVKDEKSLAPALAQIHVKNGNAFFDFTQQQDFKDATLVIGVADQGGLGLPDRDYYLNEDAKSVEVRRQYAQHIARVL